MDTIPNSSLHSCFFFILTFYVFFLSILFEPFSLECRKQFAFVAVFLYYTKGLKPKPVVNGSQTFSCPLRLLHLLPLVLAGSLDSLCPLIFQSNLSGFSFMALN